MTEPTRCQNCGAIKGHAVNCPLLSVEQKAAMMQEYYDAWLREHRQHAQRVIRMTKELTLWQGKCAILRRENNALRRKMVAKSCPAA